MADNRQLEISFVEGGNSADFVGNGWSKVEPHGRWTDGNEAFLNLPGLVQGNRYTVTLTLGPFMSPPNVTAQGLFVFANGVMCFSSQFTEGRSVTFPIPPAALNASRRVELRLVMPNAVCPKTLGTSGDGRLLGFSVWKLIVAREGEAPILDIPVQLAPPQKVAAVTMVYNEAEYLPIWLRHNARQVGIENCFIVDHGSDDGSTSGLRGPNVIRIPRSPYDPVKQSKFNTEFCASLLNWYDWVAYSDVDELLMPDPKIASSLAEYCRRPLPDVVTAIGLNSAHRPEAEPALDFSRPVTEQRRYVFTASSMCKPTLIRRPVVWSPGSHSSNAEMIFDHLYLFHLRWVDLPYGLRRLAKTRAMAWARKEGGVHQRVEDQKMTDIFMGFARLPPLDGVDFDPNADPVKAFLDLVRASRAGRENDTYKVALDIWAKHLWQLPERFVGAF